jgi:hypothetical protein
VNAGVGTLRLLPERNGRGHVVSWPLGGYFVLVERETDSDGSAPGRAIGLRGGLFVLAAEDYLLHCDESAPNP